MFGSAFGAITIAFEFARQLECKAGFTEPVDGALALKRFQVAAGERIIVVEDTITTGGSTKITIAALEATGAVIAPEVYLLVDRTDGEVLAPRRLHAAARIQVQAWDAADCPLCAEGSEAIRPKANWTQLTGRG